MELPSYLHKSEAMKW